MGRTVSWGRALWDYSSGGGQQWGMTAVERAAVWVGSGGGQHGRTVVGEDNSVGGQQWGRIAVGEDSNRREQWGGG